MLIYIKTIFGRKYPIEIEPEETFENLGIKLQSLINVESQLHNYIYHGTYIQKNKTLNDYCIQPNADIIALYKMHINKDM